MQKIVVIGAAGRMGRILVRCLAERRIEGLELAGAVDLAERPGQGEDVGPPSGVSPTGVVLSSDLPGQLSHMDAAIDFSSHSGTAGIAECLAAGGKAWVVGTTGLGDREHDAVRRAAERIPVVMAPNMSLGINLLLSLVRRAAAALADRGFDVEILERHHRRKKDAPSGTALALGEAAAEGLGWDPMETAVHGRSGMQDGDRPDRQIGFHAIRGGDFVGDHTVLFAGDGECIELSHRATTREVLALGALRAARWLDRRDPGLYGMNDVLGLRR